VSMFSGQAQLRHVDNDRYGEHDWTSVRDVLAAHLAMQPEVASAAIKQATLHLPLPKGVRTDLSRRQLRRAPHRHCLRSE
jgi:hypothetical protein